MAKKPTIRLTSKREAWAASRAAAPTFKGLPLQHNAAVAVRYEKALSNLTAQMTAQVTREILRLFETDAAAAHFGEDTARRQTELDAIARGMGVQTLGRVLVGVGEDATIASQSRILMSNLANRFTELFNKKAKPAAVAMVKDADKAGTKSLHSSLQKLSGGMSLKTSLASPGLAEITKAAIAENVSLIKSIPAQYLQQVEGAVMRSITTGNGLADLVPALEKYEGQTHRRARNIALDQTRKTYNSINRDRMQSLGLKKFMWHHSGGGAHPREDHVEMDGQVFRFDDPPVIDQRTGEKGIPGQAPNCKCTMSPVFDFGD